MVELFQPVQHHITYLACCGFSLHFVCICIFNVIDQRGHLFNADRALFDSGLQALDKLASVKRFKRAVLFIDHQHRLFNYLVGGEALAAAGTFTPPALFAFARAGIYDLGVFKTAKRTFHSNYSCSLSVKHLSI